MTRRIELLPRNSLVKTGPNDQAAWNFRPGIGRVQRSRFSLAVDLMQGQRFGKLLEIGYGSGVFMPELARHADALFGVDIHPFAAEVSESLATVGVHPRLSAGTAENLEFESRYFDAVVGVSSLEYVPDVRRAVGEIARVVADEGLALFVTPADSILANLAHRLATGRSAHSEYGDRRSAVLRELERQFARVGTVHYPLGGPLAIYQGIRGSKPRTLT